MKIRVPPRLDDRSFEQLRAEAVRRLQVACPGWTDLSPSDPGIALVEVFAYLTEVMLYRLNRVPEKQYNAFLRLIGTTQQPPAAATVTLRFSRSAPGTGDLAIPQGTRVAAAGGLTFATTAPAVLRAGQDAVDVLAFHGEQVEGEVVIKAATGAPGLEVRVQRPPVVAPMSDALELIVGVEARRGEVPAGARAIEFDGKTFRVWQEVDSFGRGDPNDCVYTVDRLHGVIRFPPAVQVTDQSGVLAMQGAALGAVPAMGREIRVSYRVGGGAAGNVAADTVTSLQDRIAGLKVTNPTPASGGRDAETLENATLRGPIDFHRLHRAVTARDFEAVATQAGGVSRAKALTKREYWSYAPPGVVEILLVPAPGAGAAAGPVSLDQLQRWATEAERAKVEAALAPVRPLGTSCEVHWTRYKPVHVKLRAVTARQEDRASVQSRVVARLHRLINPIPPTPLDEGWPYGGALRRYEVEGAVRAEPGVLYVSQVELIPERLPDGDVATLEVDRFQPRTWYAGTGSALFRSLNAGDGWELLTEFPGETLKVVRANPVWAGVLVAVTADKSNKSRVYLSTDCGEVWRPIATTEFEVNDLAWSRRQNVPLLFLATDSGLYELLADGSSAPVQLEVDPKAPSRGFYAVVATEVGNMSIVAAAAKELGGVFLSRLGGATKSFESITPAGGWDVRVLAVQFDNVRAYLWAGLTVPGTEEGTGGCYRYELRPDAPPEGWLDYTKGWRGGSCRALAFTRAGRVVAGSYWRGVVWLDPAPGATWQVAPFDVGLPLREDEAAVTAAGRLLQPVNDLAVDVSGPIKAGDRIAIATIRGVYRTANPQAAYEAVSDRSRFGPELRECVTLPPTWLFVSGAHEVEVVSEDQARGGETGGAD